MEKPFSPAADRNKEPILEVLKKVLRPEDQHLLEVGAGTGQHAVYLAPFFPKMTWQPTEVSENLPMLKEAIKEAGVANIKTPYRLKIGDDDFPIRTYDAILTVNTFHIMHWKECKSFIKLISGRLQEGGKVLIYGPFNYNGKFTTPSNEEFDKSLKQNDPLSGIRSFEDVLAAMFKNGFELVKDYEMPANNRMLYFRRLKFVSKR
jgi:cyclopropane fatty-acyl-phospholipid synthase-like methyltransferase